MAGKFKLFWSDRAEQDLEGINNFLLLTWTAKESEHFLDLLIEFEETVLKYPEAFPKSKKIKSCRLAIVHHNVSAVYKVYDDTIWIVALIDNRAKSKYK